MPTGTIGVSTSSSMEFVDITRQLQHVVKENDCSDGILHVFNPHTTAGLTINEGADPSVCKDLIGALKEIVPFDYPYTHLEGNSPSHLLATLTGSSVTVFIEGKALKLGTWQKIFFLEFDGPRSRKIHWKIMEG